jgi:predicted amidohydrolase
MDRAIVATTQHQIRVFETQEGYQEDVFRYLRMAQAKGARLVIFPALSPVMLVPPLASSPRLGLMKQADKGRGPWASLKDRLMGRAAAAAGQALGGGLRGEMNRLLNNAPEALYEAYIDLFSAAALKFKTTIVAGSLYLRVSEEANSKHICFVFGPDGQIIGQQEKIHLTVEEMNFCQAGESFNAIETDVGRIGIMIGEDVLFPESGRLLAYQKSDILINMAACDGPISFYQARHAFLARLNENELVGAQSCLIGPNRLTSSGQDFVGKSGLFTTIPLSPRLDGILFEIGAMTVEGIIAEQLDLAAMRQQWTQERPRLRQGMRVLAYGLLSDAYQNLHTLDQAYHAPAPLPGIPDTWAVEVPEEEELEPATLPSPDEELWKSEEEPSAPTMPSADDEPGPDEEERWAPTPPPVDEEPMPDEEIAAERRNLNLRGESNDQEDGFDLLASPFSRGEAEEDEDED